MHKHRCEHCRWAAECGITAGQSVLDDLERDLGLWRWQTPERRKELEAILKAMIMKARDSARRFVAMECEQIALDRGLWPIPFPTVDAVADRTVVELRCLTGCKKGAVTLPMRQENDVRE